MGRSVVARLGEQRRRPARRRRVAGVGQGEQLGADGDQPLAGRRRPPPTPAGSQSAASSSRPSNSAVAARSGRHALAGLADARCVRRRRRARSRARPLGEVAGHPRRIGAAAHTAGASGLRSSGSAASTPLGPGQDVGPQPEEAVVAERDDEPAGALELAVVEQPAERGPQLGQRGVDLGEQPSRAGPEQRGDRPPRASSTSGAAWRRRAVARRPPRRSSCSMPKAASVSSSTYRRPGARMHQRPLGQLRRGRRRRRAVDAADRRRRRRR